MTDAADTNYPPAAFTEDGELWWNLQYWPGTSQNFGDEARIAAWLAFNKGIRELFTTEELRLALGNGSNEGSRNTKEHFQRRIRELRSKRYGWAVPSKKHDHNIPKGHYRIDIVGWHPAIGPRPADSTAVSASTKRQVLERDHQRCFLCGVASREPYPGDPSRTAQMTVGHIVPAHLGGSGEESNLRAECAECNESARYNTRPPESYGSVLADIDNLKVAERRRLLAWVSQGHRGRDRVDAAYDRFRQLTSGDQSRLAEHLRKTTPS